MRELPFTKMHGCGNDYIYFDCLNKNIANPEALSRQLSHRRTGIGGDGIVLILPSTIADGRMRMFNSKDGSESAMCGNALPGVAKYLYDRGIVTREQMRIETECGIKELSLAIKGGKTAAVRVDMGPAALRPEEIPVDLTGDAIISRPVTIGSATHKITCVSMGNPHAVVFTVGMKELGEVELASIDLENIGPLFENNPIFPQRVNLSVAHVINRNHIRVRVWERGSGETWGSGTGACATAVAAVLNGYGDKDSDILVEMPGGELIIRYTDTTVYMTGDITEVFEGVTKFT
ncbi:MAG: diaminopimelate epimerase [Defluviitaleaceae bacterium]|nr:diaminopimelate epimerase [Defluviitaleaceae bacterium]